jgi:hypothetical protein
LKKRFCKVYKFIIPGIILLILLSFTSTGLAQTDSDVVVRVVPETAQVAVGGTIDIAVAVEDVQTLYGIDILLEYDPAAVEVVDMDPNIDGIQIQIGTFLEPGFEIINLINNEIGRLRLAMTQLAPAEPKDGSGNLIVVRLRGKTVSDPADITILQAKLADNVGNLIEVGTIEDGTVEVLETITDPTSTPIPGNPPGTPMPTSTATEISTQAPGATSTPAATATERFLYIPPTLTPSNTPTITPTPTQTFTPSATLVPTEVEEGQEAEPEGETVAQPSPEAEEQEEAEEQRGVSPWWFIIPGAGVIIGVIFWLIRRKRPPKLQEF